MKKLNLEIDFQFVDTNDTNEFISAIKDKFTVLQIILDLDFDFEVSGLEPSAKYIHASVKHLYVSSIYESSDHIYVYNALKMLEAFCELQDYHSLLDFEFDYDF